MRLFKLTAASAVVALMANSAHAEADSTPKLVPDRILVTAKAHLTPRGTAWVREEAQHLRSGSIALSQVEKDAAAVPNGLASGGDPDELVLLALLDARNAGGGRSQVTRADLDKSIGNVVQTLTDTQRPSEAPVKH